MQQYWARTIVLLLVCGLPVGAVQAGAESWIRIDTARQTLAVVQDDETKQLFQNISFGRNGPAEDRHEGDGRTPLGTFRVAWINARSRFHLFFGLDYPSHEQAERAFRAKAIDFDTYFAIRRALYRGEVPPQDTALGGHIGIHGVGDGDRSLHAVANWTDGCIALTDEQVEQLAKWVNIGTRVVIQ